MTKYLNGERHGYWELKDNNGVVYQKGYYVNDKRNGVWEGYRADGTIRSRCTYKNGMIEGELKLFSNDGTFVEVKSHWKGNDLVGLRQVFNNTKDIIVEEFYAR